MYRRLHFLILFVLVLSLSSTSYSQVVIGNWEDSNDGWVIDPCAPSGTAIAYSTTGVTLGTKSLEVNVPEPNWQAAIHIPLKSEGLDDEFFANDFFSMDVTRLVEEWTPNDDPNFNGGIHLIVNANSIPYGNVWFDLDGRVFWTPGDGNDPRRAGWDYSAAKADINEASVSYLQLILATSYDPNFTTGGIYYLDNAKLSTYTGVIGNFEDDMDGWSVVDDTNVSVAYEDTTGVTLGSKSLKINSASSWHQGISYSLVDQGLVDKFRNNLQVSADITRLASEWTDQGSSWCEFFLIVQAGSSGDPNWTLWGQLATEADWAPGDGDEPKNFIYDYSTVLNQIDFDNLGYLNLIFCTNWGGFNPGGTYYLDNVQMFGGGPAYNPNPANGAREVPSDATLSWTPGIYADKHDVYFGTNEADVTDANKDNPLGVLVSEEQDANNYDPGGFASGRNYYWRIDEINDAGPDPCIWPGEVWRFTTAYADTGGNYILGDWEQNMDNWAVLKGTSSYSTTGATLNNWSLKLEVEGGWWWALVLDLSDEQLEALKANDRFSLDVTWVNSDWTGNGTYAGVDTIAINAEGIGWNQIDGPVDDTSNPSNPGLWNATDFGESDTRTISWDYSGIDVNSIPEGGWCFFEFNVRHDYDEIDGTFYFDNARLVDTRLAFNPDPADNAEDVSVAPTLSWEPGKYAVTHDVYFDTDFDDVNSADRAVHPGLLGYSENQDPCTYNPGTLTFDTTYYWRIDEVNGLDIIRGSIWTFTTGHYLTVDDFEDYNNTSNKIQDTWIAGGGGTVGYPDPDYAEVTIVHGGAQSMPFDYNNPNPANYSDANDTFATAQDWTTYGTSALKSLRVWFRGYPTSVGSFDPNTYTITASGADIWNVEDQRDPSTYHDEFHYAYKKVTATTELEDPEDPGFFFDGVRIIAKVVSVSDTHQFAKGGVMIRESLDPHSTHGLMCCHHNGLHSFQRRLETGGATTETADEDSNGLPYWVMLDMDTYGNTVAYSSPNGVDGSWSRLGNPQDVGIFVPCYVGLAVTAHNATATCTADFNDVNIIAGAAGAWNNQDIGIKSNTASPLYVTLEDSTLNTATVTHDDPNATLIPTWTEWRIDMSNFTGMNRDNVKKMYIGIGDPCEGGSGTMYFDDIRLYPTECVLPERSANFAKADYAPEGNPAGDCVVDYEEIKVMGRDWLEAPPPNPDVDLYDDDEINFRDFAVLAEFWLEKQFWPTW